MNKTYFLYKGSRFEGTAFGICVQFGTYICMNNTFEVADGLKYFAIEKSRINQEDILFLTLRGDLYEVELDHEKFLNNMVYNFESYGVETQRGHYLQLPEDHPWITNK